jgi:hypothetical protein
MDSIPNSLICEWKEELRSLPSREARREQQSRVERFLDKGHGSQILRNPIAAKIVQDALLFYHDVRYALHAWAVMPTHVHALLTPAPGQTLEAVMTPLKGYAARKTHGHFGEAGGFCSAISSTC